MTERIRIGNASGFYGDRFSAMREMLTGGDLDYLTGDYLAELTMLILGRDRLRDANLGYATTFVKQMRDCMQLAYERGVRIVTNAGGLNPAGLAAQLRDIAAELDIAVQIAYVDGDDLIDRAEELGFGAPITANAYLGAVGIATALDSGADIVVTGRVTDASLTVGPAMHHFGWAPNDYDQLAGAVIAGHIIECGAQATGGNYSFFTEIDDLTHVGFPIAEVSADGSSVITKHAGTGGAVTVGTVTAQLLYEIDSPRYLGPDVTARLDSVVLEQIGPDRVGITGVRGEAPPETLKVSLNFLAGFRNEMTMILTGCDIESKAQLVQQQFDASIGTRPESVTWDLSRIDRPDASTQAQASALLRVVAKGSDPQVVGRGFSAAAVELALASYPGFSVTAPPGRGSPYGYFEAGTVATDSVVHRVTLADGSVRHIVRVPAEATSVHDRSSLQTSHPEEAAPEPLVALSQNRSEAHRCEIPQGPIALGPMTQAPLGSIAGARSGDKGGNANIGVWVRDRAHFDWLDATLDESLLKELLPETSGLTVHRYRLPNLGAINFVVDGILGRGVADNVRFDPQAKGLGEWLRSRVVDIPDSFLHTSTQQRTTTWPPTTQISSTA